MCVAVIKVKDLALPSKAVLSTCFDNNADGAGYSYIAEKDGKKSVIIRKGFLTFESFWADLEKIGKVHNLIASPMLFHFRIGTHGKKTAAEQTHPFALCDDYDIMQSTRVSCQCSVVHNGILPYDDDKAKEKPSDTMVFIKSYLSLLPSIKREWYKDKNIQVLVGRLLDGNKLAILDASGAVWYWGDWVHDEETGIYYSNSSYKERYFYYPSTAVYSSYKGYNNYLDDSDYMPFTKAADTIGDYYRAQMRLFSENVKGTFESIKRMYGTDANSAYSQALKLALHPVYIPYYFELDDGSDYYYDDPRDGIMVDRKYSRLYQLDWIDDHLYDLGHITKMQKVDAPEMSELQPIEEEKGEEK